MHISYIYCVDCRKSKNKLKTLAYVSVEMNDLAK